MKDENGIDYGARSVGRFFLALIPWAIAIGAAAWLGIWIGYHNFRHQLSQEDRAAVYTSAAGSTDKPQSKIAVEIKTHGCSHVTRADVDGTNLLMYATQNCGAKMDYFEWHWQAISSNGTVIGQGYTNQCPVPGSGEIAECRMDIKDDDRTVRLRVWAQIDP